jgi:hypothetical protein
MLQTVRRHTSKGALYDFVQSGSTTNPKGAVKEIDELLPAITDLEWRAMRELRNGLAKAKKRGFIE